MAASLLGSLLFVGFAGAAAPIRFADFIYVDANEGSGSGGHVALRLEDRTYHFGYHEPGVLRLDRDDSERFVHVYSSLENRNLQILRVAVSDAAFARLRSSFNARYLAEAEEYGVLDALAADRAFLEGWSAGWPAVEVRAAGYLERGPPGGAALARVRRRVAERYGANHLDARLAGAAASEGALAGRLESPVPDLAPVGRHPASGYGLAQTAAEAASLRLALSVLRDGARLRSGTTATIEASAFPIDEATRKTLRALSGRFEGDLVALAGSSRADVGFAMLVAAARLLALERTLGTGRLVVLDVFPPDPIRLALGEIDARGGRVDDLEDELRGELRRVRDVLQIETDLRESDYAALEALAVRFHEVQRSRATGADLRVHRGRLLPVRSARVRVETGLRPEEEVVRQRIAELRDRRAEQSARLDDAHHYNLIGHNCVSELFAQVERAVADSADDASSAESGSRTRLGGHIPPSRGLEFIPFVAARSVGESYRVDRVVEVPSHRRRRVEEMTAREGPAAPLRESNVWTSTVYRRNSLDSAFLFFTDDVLVARPLLGAANLLYGLGATVAGLPLAPFDHGRLVAAGLRGAFWSVPELAFVNVRKGSFFFVPRDPGR